MNFQYLSVFFVEIDLDYVQPRLKRGVCRMRRKIRPCGGYRPVLLAFGNGGGGGAVVRIQSGVHASRLDLGKHDAAFVTGDDVNFVVRLMPVPLQNPVSVFPERPISVVFFIFRPETG